MTKISNNSNLSKTQGNCKIEYNSGYYFLDISHTGKRNQSTDLQCNCDANAIDLPCFPSLDFMITIVKNFSCAKRVFIQNELLFTAELWPNLLFHK